MGPARVRRGQAESVSDDGGAGRRVASSSDSVPMWRVGSASIRLGSLARQRSGSRLRAGAGGRAGRSGSCQLPRSAPAGPWNMTCYVRPAKARSHPVQRSFVTSRVTDDRGRPVSRARGRARRSLVTRDVPDAAEQGSSARGTSRCSDRPAGQPACAVSADVWNVGTFQTTEEGPDPGPPRDFGGHLEHRDVPDAIEP